jgi:hypothetical protein
MCNRHAVRQPAVLLGFAFLLLSLGMARAQPAPADPTSEQVRSPLQLLTGPAVQAWIAPRAEEATAPPAEAAAPVEEVQPVATVVEGRLRRVRQNLREPGEGGEARAEVCPCPRRPSSSSGRSASC